jgi:hypothetical protein
MNDLVPVLIGIWLGSGFDYWLVRIAASDLAYFKKGSRPLQETLRLLGDMSFHMMFGFMIILVRVGNWTVKSASRLISVLWRNEPIGSEPDYTKRLLRNGKEDYKIAGDE